jgi:hypothetical protein
MPHQFLRNEDIKGQNLLLKTRDYMVDRFSQIRKVFSYSSSMGQIFLSISNHTKLVMFYIKDSILEMSFKTARRKDSIFGMAQLQGHNASRGTGAIGVVTLTPKKDTLISDLPNKIFLPNLSRIICRDNNVMYYVSLGKDFLEYDTRSPETLSFTVIQGEMRVESFVGDGTDNQMYSVAINNQAVDMNHIIVEVNGVRYQTKESFAEIGYMEKACVVRTGLTAGIDVIFGKEIYSNIPQQGSNIKIYYPIIVGSQGNRNYGLFEFADPMFSADGEDFNVRDLFDLTVTKDFKLGSDAESSDITKIIAPNVNRNRIVFDKKSTKYFFDKTNLFAKVDVFNKQDPTVMEVFLYPRIEDKIESGRDLFSMSSDDILVDKDTKQRLLEWVNRSRSQSIDIRIEDPTVKRYSILLKLGVLSENMDRVNIDEIKAEKREILNKELSKFENTNRIAKSDIIKAVYEGVESVSVQFEVEESRMLDELGDIIVDDKEIAIPISPFVSSSGDQILKSLVIEIVWL